MTAKGESMYDFIIDELLDEPLPHRTGPTGPRTPAGKAKSSENSLQHGLRSAKTVLRDEDPAAFEATVQHWFTHYQPGDAAALSLVENVALADWQLKRNQKRLDEIEWELPDNAHGWTEEQHKRYAIFTRYYTTAERRFLRNFKEVEAYYHRIHRDDHVRQLAFAKLAAIEFKRLDKADEAALKEVRVEQVIEVEVLDGQCRTYFYPSDREVIETAAKRPTPPLYIVRRILFASGFVPAEYAWANPVRIKEGELPQIMQRILWPHWLELIQRETSTPGSHIGPNMVKGTDPRRPKTRSASDSVNCRSADSGLSPYPYPAFTRSCIHSRRTLQ
jgi:hypothetical protein